MELNYTNYLKVLVVEDDSRCCEFLKKFILKVPQYIFEFCFVDTFSIAFKILDENKIDVIIVNLSNDKATIGLEELNKKYSHITVVVIIDIYEDNLKLKTITNGTHEYLIKGMYNERGLIKTINSAFNRKCEEKLLDKLNECFLNLGCDGNKNFNKIVENAGKLLDGNFAFYCKEEGTFLCMMEFWNIPKDFKQKAIKTNCINYEVITASRDEPLVINNFDTTFYAKANTNISNYKIKTYIGCAVKIDGKAIGSLCVGYNRNKTLTKKEVKTLSILAKSLSIEERRKKSEDDRGRWEKKYRMLFDNVSDAIFITDPKSNVLLDVNKKAEALIGESREKLIGMPHLQLYPPDKFEKYIYNGIPAKFEAEIVKKNGDMVPVAINVNSIEMGCESVNQRILKDLSEAKRLQEELIHSNKMVTMGQLSAGISHELNQPLTGIKGFAQVALMDLDENSLLRNDLQKIIEQAERMENIVQSVRSFARKLKFRVENVDINKSLKASLMFLKHQLKICNIRVDTFFSKNLPKIKVDNNEFQQVFLNLIINARDAICSLKKIDNGRLIVKTVLSEDKNNIVITFQDTGGGISKGNADKVFTPFFTTKFHEGGMGMGLSIVKRIVEKYKGTIEFESVKDISTTFRIIIPIFASEFSL